MTETAAPSVGRVFISYRRQETAYAAGWLFDRLVDRYGRGQIFKDVDSIELGDDFVEVISTAVGSCDVLLALIGDQWLTIADELGRARLDDPDDFVRLEIEAALTRNVLVIPVLVEGARMPRADELPASLSKLIRRQALELSPSRFEFDTNRLLNVLDRALAEVPPPPPITEPLVTSGGPSAEAIAAPSGELAGVEPARVNARRRRVLTAAAAGAVVVAVGVTAALVLLPSDDPQRTDATEQTEPTDQTEPTERTLEIPSTELWTDTDVDCETGDVLDISATGTVLHNKEDVASAVDPNGLTDPFFHQHNVPGLPDANTVGLIGSIDREQPFFVGTGTTYECPGAGRLFLGINDTGVANNSGEFIATIEQRHDN
jgi:TIR domain